MCHGEKTTRLRVMQKVLRFVAFILRCDLGSDRLYYALWWVDHERPKDIPREHYLEPEADVFMMFLEEYELL
jgi:hypothetical protein